MIDHLLPKEHYCHSCQKFFDGYATYDEKDAQGNTTWAGTICRACRAQDCMQSVGVDAIKQAIGKDPVAIASLDHLIELVLEKEHG